MVRFIRILPLTIFMAVLFLAVKVMDVTRGTQTLLVSQVSAQQHENGEKPLSAEEHAPAEAPKEEPKKDEAKPAEPAKEEKHEEKSEEGGHGEGGHGEGGKEEKKNPAVSEDPGNITDRHFSQSEMDLLQNLSRRREQLDRWERNIQVKEEALNATEKRIAEKIQEIDNMKKAVSELLAQYNAQEETKLKSLVKIYENMKPDDAARIFDEVEMPILLLVIDKMSEKKAAPILAKMDSKKAKQVTVELAEQRRLSTAKLNASTKTLPQ